MQKVIFVGTDLHNSPTELASKLVSDLSKEKESVILSIQNRKNKIKQKKMIIVPRIFKNNLFRKIAQSIILPFYLIILRFYSNKIFTFWVADKKYHYFLFWFLKRIKYKIYFTVISGYDKKYDNLIFCEKIICQSEKMKEFLKKKYNKRINLILPWTNIKYNTDYKKKEIVGIISVPYSLSNFDERGINNLLNVIKKNKIKSKILVRSDSAEKEIKLRNIKNIEIINKSLNQKELSNFLKEVKVVPVIYNNNAPDVPLTIIEAVFCGCSVLCSDNLGISKEVSKLKCGKVIPAFATEKEIELEINKLLKKRLTNSKEYFYNKYNFENIKKYCFLFEE